MSSPSPSTRIHPFLGTVCLLAYLCFATPLMPVVTAMAAWFDGEHHVSVSMERDGARVILSHDASDPRKDLTHSHCLVSHALTLLAEPAGPEHTDHVLNFQTTSSTMLRSATLRTAVQSADEMLVAPAAPVTLPFSRPVTTVEAPPLDLPPPATSVVVARATVFLI
jgi:hypothetical protein